MSQWLKQHSFWAARAVAVTIALACPAGAAQLLTRDHPGQYTQEDIAAGSRVYGPQRSPCHGRDGDQISGIDLRRACSAVRH